MFSRFQAETRVQEFVGKDSALTAVQINIFFHVAGRWYVILSTLWSLLTTRMYRYSFTSHKGPFNTQFFSCRDFFPDLKKLRAQKEYLDAVERKDIDKLRELAAKYTPKTKSRTNTPMFGSDAGGSGVGGSGVTPNSFETPTPSGSDTRRPSTGELGFNRVGFLTSVHRCMGRDVSSHPWRRYWNGVGLELGSKSKTILRNKEKMDLNYKFLAIFECLQSISVFFKDVCPHFIFTMG